MRIIKCHKMKVAIIVHDFSFLYLINLYTMNKRDQNTYFVYSRKYHIKGEVVGAHYKYIYRYL